MKYSSQILSDIGESLDTIDDKSVDEFVDSIIRADKIFIYGSGRSGLICQLFAVRLVQIGLKVHFVGEMTTPIVGKEDLVILVSNTGKTMSVNQTAVISKRIGSKVIAITSNRKNALGNTADLVIEIPSKNGEYAPLGTVFEDATGIFFDGIVPEIMRKKGINEQNMRDNHAIWV